jgi:prepilin-type processing-associated H-X9-DG protein
LFFYQNKNAAISLMARYNLLTSLNYTKDKGHEDALRAPTSRSSMTPILKKRLTFLGVAASLGSGLPPLMLPAMAQEAPEQAPPAQTAPPQNNSSLRTAMGFNAPRVNLTRDVAAQKFLQLLNVFSIAAGPQPSASQKPDAAMMSSFSRSSDDENLPGLLLKLSEQKGSWDQNVTVQNEGDKTATVTIETKSKPLVLVQEGESWGVDVGETFARWNNVEGAAKDAALTQAKAEFREVRDVARRSSCQSNLKQISLGLMQYAQDYGEQLPKAENWIDKLQPYVKSERLFNCPSVSDPVGYGYAFNLNLSLQSLAAFDSPAQTVSIYETSVLERNMYGLGDEPAFRHQDGANYAFADGHVKWLPKAEIPSFKLNP